MHNIFKHVLSIEHMQFTCDGKRNCLHLISNINSLLNKPRRKKEKERKKIKIPIYSLKRVYIQVKKIKRIKSI